MDDIYSINEAKEKLGKHGKTLGLSGWHIDSDLRKRRQKLEVKILTILNAFQDKIEHRNWVKFIESSDAGHATLKPHINELYKQMHAIAEEYEKYSRAHYSYTSKGLEQWGLCCMSLTWMTQRA